jgi:hypothetical protein
MLPKKILHLPGGGDRVALVGTRRWKKGHDTPATDPFISTGGLEVVSCGAGRNPVSRKPINGAFVAYLSIIIMYS